MFKHAVKYCDVRKHKAVKLNAKIMDSRFSRIQMGREKNFFFLETRYLCIFYKKKKKGRGRIASWVIKKFAWNASESTEMT